MCLDVLFDDVLSDGRACELHVWKITEIVLFIILDFSSRVVRVLILMALYIVIFLVILYNNFSCNLQ